MIEFQFFTTSGCHLCEQAEEVIQPLLTSEHVVEVIEIADSDALIARYGVRIPVLKRLDTGLELDWPFGQEAVRALLG